MKIDIKTLLLILILGGILTGVIAIPNIQIGSQPTTPTIPTTPPTEPTEPTEPTGHPAAKLTWVAQEAITQTTFSGDGGDCSIDITVVLDGVIDLLHLAETVEQDGAPNELSGLSYAEGSTVILHFQSDDDNVNGKTGQETYDGWFYVTLLEGEPLRKFSPAIITPTQTSPTYKYQFTGVGQDTGYRVQWEVTSSGGFQWNIGILSITERVAKADLDCYFVYGGTTMAKVEDGSTWDDDASEVIANATLATDDEDLYLRVIAGGTNVAYGLPMYVITSKGKLEEYRAVAMVSTNMTAIGDSEFLSTQSMPGGDTWHKVNDATLYAEKGFYTVLEPVIPSKGTKFQFEVKIPVDAAAASGSTKHGFKLWMLDFQLESNVAVGSTSTSLPTVYGMVSDYGPDSIMHSDATANGWGTSGGVGSGHILLAYLTTAA